MKTHRLLIILFLCVACAACGNKGPLVHPDKATETPTETAPDKETPVESKQ